MFDILFKLMRVFRVPKNLKIYKKVNYPPHNSSFNLEGEISRRLIKRSKDILSKEIQPNGDIEKDTIIYTSYGRIGFLKKSVTLV